MDEHTYSVGQTVKFALNQPAECGYNVTVTIVKLLPWGEYLVKVNAKGTFNGIEISAGDDDMAPLDEEPAQATETVVEPSQEAEPTHVELPALQGSEKQVKWASDIRSRYLVECQEAIAEVQAKEGQDQASKVQSALYVVLAYPRYRDASYWITRRNSQGYKEDIMSRMRNVLIGRVVESDKV